LNVLKRHASTHSNEQAFGYKVCNKKSTGAGDL